MPVFDILCLANSNKMRGSCVAGLRLDGGGWIRPVARTPGGELYPAHYVLDDGTCPRVFDVIRVSFEGPRPKPHHPEDWLIGDEPWQLVSRGLRSEFAVLLRGQLQHGPTLLGDSSGRIPCERFSAEPARASLALVQPRRLAWAIDRTPENAHKARALFELGGSPYRLPVTDPAFLDTFRALGPGRYPPEACGIEPRSEILLTVSLSEPWEDGCCYKLAAAVMAVLPEVLADPQELMESGEAAWILNALAGGTDPYTGEPLPDHGPLANPDTRRALRAALAALAGAEPPKKLRRPPERAGKSWEPDEDQQLLREFDSGQTVAQIARVHGRTRAAIHARLLRHGRIRT